MRLAELELPVSDTELPEGWAVTTIGRAYYLNPPKPPVNTLPADAPITFVPMPAVDASQGTISAPLQRPFSEVRNGFTAFAENDVLMAKITPCMENGKAAVARGLINGLGFGSTEFHILRPTGVALPEFVYHFIRQDSFRVNAEKEMTGSVGQRRVPAAFLRDVEMPLPPLAEQRRIVAKLEQVLTAANASHERLVRVPALMKRFRRSVLAAACSGRLTADWREQNPEVEPAAQLLERILDECRARWQAAQTAQKQGKSPTLPLDLDSSVVDPPVRKQQVSGRSKYQESAALDTSELPELPESWCWARISAFSQCLDSLRQPINAQERSKRSGCIPYYGANGQVGWIDKYLFDEDLVLVVEDETFVGRQKPFSYVVRGKSWVNNHAHVLRPCGNITADLLNMLLSYYDFVPLTSGTTGRRKLNQAALVDAPVALPPLAEQQEIVRQVEKLFKFAEAVERRTDAAAARVDRLTQAVLARAFRGELVPTEAELAHAEERDYQPASVLLERIQAERERPAGGMPATKEGRSGQRRAGRNGRGTPEPALDL